MSANIAALIDKAKVMHRLSSDYKLALVMGISHVTLLSYRQGKTLPDTRVIAKICELTGDDPALMAVQIEEQRAKTDEARALWHQVAERLQAAAATAVFAVAFLVSGMVGFPSDAQAKTAFNSNFSSYTSWNVSRLANNGLFRRLIAPAVRYLRGLFTGGYLVPRTASTAAA